MESSCCRQVAEGGQRAGPPAVGEASVRHAGASLCQVAGNARSPHASYNSTTLQTCTDDLNLRMRLPAFASQPLRRRSWRRRRRQTCRQQDELGGGGWRQAAGRHQAGGSLRACERDRPCWQLGGERDQRPRGLQNLSYSSAQPTCGDGHRGHQDCQELGLHEAGLVRAAGASRGSCPRAQGAKPASARLPTIDGDEKVPIGRPDSVVRTVVQQWDVGTGLGRFEAAEGWQVIGKLQDNVTACREYSRAREILRSQCRGKW